SPRSNLPHCPMRSWPKNSPNKPSESRHWKPNPATPSSPNYMGSTSKRRRATTRHRSQESGTPEKGPSGSHGLKSRAFLPGTRRPSTLCLSRSSLTKLKRKKRKP
ncbi:hypothetical protein GGI23_005968, partial [Coemansia sp. RSA 2559]